MPADPRLATLAKLFVRITVSMTFLIPKKPNLDALSPSSDDVPPSRVDLEERINIYTVYV